MEQVVFHIISRTVWGEAQGQGTYVPDRYMDEGFIHLSKRGQILRPANLLYQGRDDLLLLEIDAIALEGELRYEPGSHGEGEHFPHLYGPLNLDAVRTVHDFPCQRDGRFSLPADVVNETEES